jgi:hypothetical protein
MAATKYHVGDRVEDAETGETGNAAKMSRVGRKKRWHDVMGAKFPAGTFKRVAALLGEKGRPDRIRPPSRRARNQAARAQTIPRKEGPTLMGCECGAFIYLV